LSYEKEAKRLLFPGARCKQISVYSVGRNGSVRLSPPPSSSQMPQFECLRLAKETRTAGMRLIVVIQRGPGAAGNRTFGRTIAKRLRLATLGYKLGLKPNKGLVESTFV
jgi:hypothetical protein